MPGKPLAIYESWDVTPPPLPPRSRLYHLEPIGIGTPYVESLTSYAIRLAEAHSVSARHLFEKEIAPRVENAFRAHEEGRWRSYIPFQTARAGFKTVNGIGIVAARWIQALEGLTLRNDLRFLTLRPWANVLTPMRLLRRMRAWCPTCYTGWQGKGQPLYEPLLWMIASVTVCPCHRQPLQSQCPYCQRSLPMLESYSQSGHCSKCGQGLGHSGPASDAQGTDRTKEDLTWRIWMAEAIGEVLAAAPHQPSFPPRERVAYAISACIDQVAGGSAAAFARLLHAGTGAVPNWRSGKFLPRMDALARACYVAGISLLHFLVNEVIDVKNKQVTRSIRSASRVHNVIDLGQLKRALEAALAEYPPPSIPTIAQRLGCTDSPFYEHFPDLSRAVGARHKEYRKACHRATWEKARVVIEKSLEESPPVSPQQLAERLGCCGNTLYTHFPELYRATAERYATYRKACHAERRAQALKEVKRVTLQLHAEGIYPSQKRVLARLENRCVGGAVDATRREALRELGIVRREIGDRTQRRRS